MDSYGIAKSGSAIDQLIARTDGRTNERLPRLETSSQVLNAPTPVETEKRLRHWLRAAADKALERNDWAEFSRLRELAVIR
jgi:hypothetical protein